MRLRSAGLLSIALCFYFVGAPLLDSLSGVVPFASMMDMIIVGLFLGLLPWWEGAAFYLFTAGIDTAQILVEVPYMQAKFSALIAAAQTVTNFIASISVLGFVTPDWIFIGAIFLIMGIIFTLFVNAVLKLLKDGKTIILLIVASTVPLIIIGYVLLKPIIDLPILAVTNNGLMVDAMVNFAVFFELYLVFASPFLGYYLFKWLSVYRRVPRLIHNS